MVKKIFEVKNLIILGFILSLLFFAIKPFFYSGFFPVHDDTQVARVYEMTQALKDGMFPVRWSKDLGFGYGYPIFTFYAPLAYYSGSIFNLAGLNSLDSTKMMMIFGILLSFVSMFFLAKEFFGKEAAIVSALLYLYAPYHGVDIFVRGDVAEFYAYAIIPLVFLGIYKIFKNPNLNLSILTGASFALLILSHNLTAFIATPFLVLFALFMSVKNKKSIIYYFLAIFMAAALSAFYWLPVVFELNYTNVVSQVGGGADFRDHFVCFSQLWASPWGYGGSAKGCVDGLSFMIGKIHIIISLAFPLVFLILTLGKKIKNWDRETLNIVLIFTFITALSIFMMLPLSKIVWENSPFINFVQYPWRLLIIAVLSLSLICGATLSLIKKYFPFSIFLIFISDLSLFIVFYSQKFFVPKEIVNKASLEYTSRIAIAWEASKLTSEYMPKGFDKPKSLKDIANPKSIDNANVSLDSFTQETNQVKLVVNSKAEQEIVLPLAYFPAWYAKINGKPAKLTESKRGMMLSIGEGLNTISLNYRETNVELFADLVSLGGIVLIIIGIIRMSRIK